MAKIGMLSAANMVDLGGLRIAQPPHVATRGTEAPCWRRRLAAAAGRCKFLNGREMLGELGPQAEAAKNRKALRFGHAEKRLEPGSRTDKPTNSLTN